MRASLKFTVWTIVVFSCVFEISQAQCNGNGSSCNSNVLLNTTTTTISAENCNLSAPGFANVSSSISGLQPGTVYIVNVHCFNCCLQATTKPENVANLTAQSTTTSLGLKWTKPHGNVHSYNVKWTGGGRSGNMTTLQQSADVHNLTSGVEYTVSVAAVAGDGKTEGAEVTISQFTKPQVIQNLTVADVTTSSMNVTWTEPEGHSSFYIVQWIDKGTSKNMNSTVTDKVITDLTAGVEYTVTVTAVAGDGKTTGSGTSKSWYTKPQTIQNLTVVNVTTSSMTVTWTEPEGHSSSYIVQWIDKSTSMNTSRTVTETSTVITDLTAGVEYSVTVTAVAGDNKTIGAGTNVTRYTQPQVVKNPNVVNVTTSSMTVTWTEPEGHSSSYIVQWIDKSTSMNTSRTVTETSTVITDLTAGVEYSVTVTAVAGDNKTIGAGTNVTRYTQPQVIQNLTVVDVTTSSMNVTWTEPEGHSSSYIVQWIDKSTSMNTSRTVTETSTVITDLTAGVEYSVTVTAVAGDNKTIGAGTNVTRYTQPQVIQNLTVVDVTTSSMNVTWTEPEGHSSFYIVQWIDKSTSKNITFNVTDKSTVITNLTAGVEYSATVTAVAGDGKTAGSGTSKSWYTKPQTIQNLTVVNVTTSSMTVTWTEPEGHSSSYIVQWIDKSTSMNTSRTVTETSTVITDLTAGVEYSVTVTAVAGDNKTIGAGTNVTRYTQPQVIQNLTVVNVTTSSMTVTWTEPEGHSSSYIVQWIDKSTSMNTSRTVTETSTVITDLTAGVEYSVTVTAVAGDNKTIGAVTNVTRYTQPQVIQNLTVVDVTTSSMNVTWTEPEGHSSSYIVQWIDKRTSMNTSRTVTETSTVITDLTAGVEYSVTVTAVAGDNKTIGAGTNVTRYTQPQVIQNLTVVDVTTSSMNVTWTEPEGHSSFYIVQWIDKSTSKNITFNVTDKSTVITNLTAGVEYSATVTAVAGDGKTTGSGTSKSWYTKPQTIQNLTVVNVTTSSMTVTWTEPEGHSSSYIVQWIDKSTSMNTSRTVTETSTVITDLTAGVEYSVTVTAVAGDNKTIGAGTNVTRYTQPQVIQNLTVVNVTTSSMTVTWTEPEGHSSSYIVQWIDKSTSMNTSRTVTETSTVITDLTAGVEYSVTVTAVAGDNKTIGAVTNVTRYTQPQVIQNLTVVDVTTSSMNVTWTEPEGHSSSYIVQWIDKRTSMNTSRTVTETSTVITDLTAGVEYSVTVTAVAGDNKTIGAGTNVTRYTQPQVIQNLTVVDVTTSSMNVTWTEPEGHSSFYIVQWIDKSTSKNITFNVTDKSTVITNLTAGVEYSATVTAVAGDGKTTGSGTSKSWYTKPQTIQNLTVVNVTTSSMTVTWTEPEGHSSSYIVQWIDKSTSMNTSRTVTETSTVITDLTAGVEYSVTVTAVAGDNKTIGAGTNVTRYTQPQVIQNLTVVNVTTSSMTVTWTEPEGHSSSYIVQWIDKSTSMNTSRTVTETSTVITDLTAGVEYSVTVTAVAGDNKTIGAVTNVTRYTQPQVIQNLTVVDVTTSSMNVTWTEPEGHSSSYIVQWIDKRTSMNTSRTVTETSTVITDLTAGVEYSVTVTAVAGDNKTIGAGTNVTRYTQPQVIQNLTVVDVTTSSMNVTWTEPEGHSSSYIVQWIDKSTSKNITFNVTDKSTVITNLTAGVEYSVSVTAVAGDGKTTGSGTSKSWYTKPQTIQNLTVVNVTTSSMTVTWTEPEGHSSSYIVQWIDQSTSKNTSRTVTETSTVITDLTAGVEYSVTVTAVAGDNKTIGTGTNVTLYTQPQVVKNPNVVNVTTSSMTVTWTEPEGHSSSYIVQWIDKSTSMNTSRTVTETSTVITDLTAGVEYSVTVTAVAGDNKTIGAGTNVTRYTQPQVIQNLTVVDVTTSSMNVTWTEPEGHSSSYIVQWIDKSTSMNTSRTVTETSTVITDLTAGVEYSVTVTAVAGDNKTIGAGTNVTRYTQPQVIQNLTVADVTTSSMNVTWTEPEGHSSSYIVQWIDKSTSKNITFNVTDKYTVITDLTAGVEYSVSVTAVAGDGKTTGSDISKSWYTRPGKIEKLSVSPALNELSFHWDKPDGHVFIFKSVLNHSDGNSKTLYSEAANISFDQLTPGTRYTIALTAVAGDNKTEGESYMLTTVTLPAKPVNITLNQRESHSLNISWTLPEGNADHYVVQLDQKENQTHASSLRFTGLSPGQLHTVSVTAVAGHLNNTSEPSTFATYPLPPGSISVIQRTNSSLNLTWDVDPEMLGAPNINYSVAYEGGESDLKAVMVSHVVLTELNSGTEYAITVTTIGPENLRRSGVKFVACTNPNAVLDLTAYPESNTSVKVKWSYPQDYETKNYSYSILTYDAKGNNNSQSVERNYTFVTGLVPGTRYNITVTTLLTTECKSTEEEVSSYTKPNPVSNLQVQFVNTSTITLTWVSSIDYEPTSSYFVQAHQGPNVVRTESTATQSYTFKGLTPGELYTFTVSTEVAGVRSDDETITEQMRPAVVTISEVTGSTTRLTVSWSEAEGKVDTYTVLLYNDTHLVQSKEGLSNSTLDTSFSDLTPGVQYCAEIVTKSGDLMNNSSRVCNSTWPAVVTITEIIPGSTTHLTVSWSEAEGKVDTYTVLLYNDTHLVQSKQGLSNSTLDTSFSDLTPGVQYCAEVVTKSGNLMNNSSRVCNSTWPAVVTITDLTGSTTYLTVSWSEAEGKVDTYTVFLYIDSQLVNKSKDLSSDTFATSFTDLKPGVLYCAAVVTKSGPLENKSSDLCNATFPNPPRNIRVTSRTEQSLTFMWDTPEDMQPDQYNFSVTTYTGPKETENSSLTLNQLESGSPYNITIVTVGVNNYESQEVREQAYTKPYSVTDLRQTEITPYSVKLVWNQTAHKSDYTYFIEVSGGVNSTTFTNFTHEVVGLISGTNYSFTVTTRAADGTPATPETVSYFTRPYGINDLVADTINTTSINVTWEQPVEYKAEYEYLVETSGCSDPENLTTSNESVEIPGLTPGTNCSFCVTVRAANGIKGESNCTYQYTKPEKAQPRVSNQGSNSSLLVSWAKPPGNVELYTVYLNGTETNLTTATLNSSGRFHTFEGLSAGRLYTVVVETQSGNFASPSESITNATYPNPPGAITILNKTTNSIHISWEEAPLMTGVQFYYRLEIPSEQVKNTTATNDTFAQLKSGTPYNVSVATVAAMGFESEATRHNMVTTRPFSVKNLQADPSEESVTLQWRKPEDYKGTYRFRVTLGNSSENFNTTLTPHFKQPFDQLDPGSSYRFTVTTETSDGTPGAPEEISECTNASAVEFLECSAPNVRNATITWSWEKPRGLFSNFTVKFENLSEVHKGFKFEKSKLHHHTNYTVGVTTQSCGNASITVTKTCQSGITNPPIQKNYIIPSSNIDTKPKMFTIKVDRSLLDQINGPIKYAGVLVTQNTDVVEPLPQYLETTYDQWKKEKNGVYLATVIDITDSDVKVKTRSTPDPLTIHIGDENPWHGYENGILNPTEKYIIAIVLFTDLKIKKGLINGSESLYSVTDFNTSVKLPQSELVIGLAVGLTLSIFFILLILLIGFIIYWKRLANKKSSDVQIKSKRSAPVRVEDYEVYYKKQKADSNCGFAAEYEDLKVVGNGLAKTNATNPEIKSKNRYNNVLPYDSSRVKLSIINGNPLDDYINANYIPGYNSRKEFIAAQGPLPTTVNDFWRMIWEKNVHAIVMLTRCNEQGRVKCEQYWTPGTKHFGNITVTTTSEIPLDDWTIRDFDVKNVKTAETRSVRQFHFTAWPDHGVPETTELLISFRHLVREHMDQYRHSPTVVHCSAGVGRTGTFIAIDRLIFQIERENVVDIYSIVYDMRLHRVLMVQTEDQYVFLNQCALDIIRSRTGTNVDLIYQNITAVSIYENIELQKRES